MSQPTTPPAPLEFHALRTAASTSDRLQWLQRAIAVESVLPVRDVEASSALRAVQELNNLAGEPLAEWIPAQIGQGLRLTRRGRRVAVALLVLQQAQQRLNEEFTGHFADDVRLLDRVVLRSSARNQFAATVDSICDLEEARNEIVLRLCGGQKLRTWITHGSTESLGLVVGVELVAMCKATAVSLLDEQSPVPEGVWDVLPGTIADLSARGGRAEVSVGLAGGLTAIAVVDHPRQWHLDQAVQVLFHPASIVLGIVG